MNGSFWTLKVSIFPTRWLTDQNYKFEDENERLNHLVTIFALIKDSNY